MSTDKTFIIFDDSEANEATRPASGSDTPFTENIQGSSTTRDRASEESTVFSNAGGEQTVIFTGNSASVPEPQTKFDGDVDPVVGWLVVLEGPGKGRSIQLGYGLNSIGRARSERVSLDFGDTMISNTDHAKIIYDDRGFYISHGSGKNVTKVNGTLVPNMIELKNFSTIDLTKSTRLAFVALCSATFDWSDLEKK